MADQQLYRVDRGVRYEHIEPVLSGTINQDLILGRWDDLVRLAASLKMGWATASLLVSKLQCYRRQNALMRALQEYGRLIKSIHIVRCLDSREYRKRIGIQLNKGESLHDLRRFLFFANEGEIRRSQYEDQTVQALCLNLVTNAVITWHTPCLRRTFSRVGCHGSSTLGTTLRFVESRAGAARTRAVVSRLGQEVALRVLIDILHREVFRAGRRARG